jgi:MATE family multidrug resistance protein
MPMWIMIGGNVVNIIGNYLLIFGKMGCPELGLLGAGIATLLSRVMMALVLLLVIMKMRRYEIYREGFRKKMTREGVRHLSRKGLPIGLQMCMEASSFSLCAVMMGWIGAVPLAAHQIMCTVGSLCFMVYYGIGAAVAIRISHFCGQGQWTEVRRTANVGLTMTLATGVFLSTFIFLLRVPIADLFTTSEEVVSMVVLLVVPIAFYFLLSYYKTCKKMSSELLDSPTFLLHFSFLCHIQLFKNENFGEPPLR